MPRWEIESATRIFGTVISPNAREQPGRVDSESQLGNHPIPVRHRLAASSPCKECRIDRQNEKTGRERHYWKEIALITRHPPGRVEERKEDQSRDDRCAEESE